MVIEAWFDGCCEPINPGGHAACGAFMNVDGMTVWEHSEYLGCGPKMSNNVAEYRGLIAVLKEIIARGWKDEPTFIKGDSKLVIMQTVGKWKAHGGLYLPHYEEARPLANELRCVRFSWTPRNENDRADELSKRPLRERGVEFRMQPERR